MNLADIHGALLNGTAALAVRCVLAGIHESLYHEIIGAANRFARIAS